MANELLPITDRDAGVDRVRKASLAFLKRYDLKIDFDIDKIGMKTAIEDVWDELGSLDYRSLVTGTPNTSLSDTYLSLLVYAVARAQFEQYAAQLPLPDKPGIPKGNA